MNSSFLCTNKGHLDHSLLLLPHLRTFDILSLERDLHVCKYLENSPRKSQFCFLIYFCCYFIPFSLNSHWSLLYSNLSNKLKCIKNQSCFTLLSPSVELEATCFGSLCRVDTSHEQVCLLLSATVLIARTEWLRIPFCY